MLQTLGPLIFPIYRASLLKKRVLLISQPPLLPVCDFGTLSWFTQTLESQLTCTVHLLSQCSAIPPDAQDDDSDKSSCLKPLYTVGVHDIPALSSSSAWAGVDPDAQETGGSTMKTGWIACTSDELLSTKTQLSELRIKFANTAIPHSLKGAWPTVAQSTTSTAEIPLLASRRDLQRWEMLVENVSSKMQRTPSTDDHEADDMDLDTDDANDDRTHLLSASAANSPNPSPSVPVSHTNTSAIIEPLSWSASLAQYSARAALASERMHECDDAVMSAAMAACTIDTRDLRDDDTTPPPIAAAAFVQAYFRASTKRIFDVLRARVDEGSPTGEAYRDEVEDEADDDTAPLRGSSGTGEVANTGAEAEVVITRENMIHMGLDVWSASDAAWVQEIGELWFGKKMRVQAGEVEVCGVRVW